MVKAESNFDPAAVSRAGAKGLMQLMDGTSRGYGVTSPFDPVQNVYAGTAFFGELLDKYRGNASLALAAYNAGPDTVDKYRGIPPFPETRQYVERVLEIYHRLKKRG